MSEQKVESIKKELPRVLIEIGIALAGSCFLALLSQVAIPLPFTPIPVTLQTLGVFLLGGILGSRRAVYSVLGYLIQGCCGFPVFAGGVANPLWIGGVQAGFLVSFVGAAYLIGFIGKMCESQHRFRFFSLVLALTVGQLVIFAGGAAWLACYVGWKKAFLLGVAPFFTGAVLKILAGAMGLWLVGKRS